MPDIIIYGKENNEVDYTQLIPILIQAVKDLKAEVEELKAANTSLSTQSQGVMRAPHTSGIADGANAVNGCKLYQNTPNPAEGNTVIKFQLPDNVDHASIVIFKNDGTLVRQIAVDSSMTDISIDSHELQPDIYLYSLIVNSQRVDTKRMVVR